MKKISLILIGTLLVAQSAFAEENIVQEIEEAPIYVYTTESKGEEGLEVDSDLIGFVDIFQEVAIDLTEDESNKMLLLVKFISQSNEKLQALLNAGEYEQATNMLNKYNEDVAVVQEILETPNAVKDPEELTVYEEVLEQLPEKTSMRGVNLEKLLSEGTLPATALAGIEKALANQERAQAKRQEAKDRKAERKALKVEETNEEEVKEEEVETIVEAANAPKSAKPEKAVKVQEKALKKAEKNLKKAEKSNGKGKGKAEQAKERNQGKKGKSHE
ncbi:DUF5667 domain-containing protein [Halalkalibacter akibai]|uniref:DUF5667 domain-containing protein n=1 Tax=Halalkalibacter akibai (strain ATCC 43226 / DSM 21942 / CIP 109018 / JCM 9157 / 1139) TaxID=1236973 RepID=W4QSC5_HALA3|nr:DUF5667 domain-containing protein [Halalkalibacter akibai]GAE34832.1 hypothetical protein JCM9157_1912 [Halalkalibacter akibai JCM 9157]